MGAELPTKQREPTGGMMQQRRGVGTVGFLSEKVF
jgi:hypothetical protein